MKKLNQFNDLFKILIIYFLTTVISMIAARFIVKYDFIPVYLRNYLWVAIIFTFSFLLLISLFKVKFKAILIFLGLVSFLLLFLIINSDFFISISTTPDPLKFPIITFIAIFLTIPFQSIIYLLVGYNLGNIIYIILPLYMILLVFLSYISLNIKETIKTNKE